MHFTFQYPHNSERELDDRLLTHVFIDYESYLFSLKNIYNAQPDLKSLVDDFMTMGQIKAIKVFGDFSQPALAQEKNRIRTMTSHIVDCGWETGGKKDVTDFIMLNEIYQTLIENEEIRQYILVTGDGHFSSVATFMRVFMGKVVGIYGVKETLSRQLRECASWSKYIDIIEPEYLDYVRFIAGNLRFAEQQGKIATFRRTCELVQQRQGGSYELCERYLWQMIAEGLVLQELFDRGEYQVVRLLVDEEKLGEMEL